MIFLQIRYLSDELYAKHAHPLYIYGNIRAVLGRLILQILGFSDQELQENASLLKLGKLLLEHLRWP